MLLKETLESEEDSDSKPPSSRVCGVWEEPVSRGALGYVKNAEELWLVWLSGIPAVRNEQKIGAEDLKSLLFVC